MATIQDRLIEIRKYLKLSVRDFAKEISYSHGVYHQVEHGDREINERMTNLICSRFNINEKWLLLVKVKC
jgi:transcriptional regulator with XRE-family HTH domain